MQPLYADHKKHQNQKLFLAPFVSLAPLALTSLRLCFLCVFAFILGGLGNLKIRGRAPGFWQSRDTANRRAPAVW